MLRLATQPLEGDALVLDDLETFDVFLKELRDNVLDNLKKKVAMLLRDDRISAIIASLLWDAPPERRLLLTANRDLVAHRSRAMSAPKREAVLAYLGQSTLFDERGGAKTLRGGV